MARVRRSLNRWFFGLSQMDKLLVSLLRARQYFSDWGRLFMTYVGLRGICPRETFNLRFPPGAKIMVWEPADTLNLWAVFCGPEYEVLPSDTLIIDVGANVGMFTSYAAICAPRARIVAYEPVSRTYKRLRQQVTLLGIEDRVVCQNIGIASEDGEGEIYVGQSSDISSLYPREADTSVTKEIIQVASLTSVVKEFEPYSISLLKMDCEGAEWGVFDTASNEALSKIERICLEYHPLPGRDKGQLISRLTESGYTLHKLVERRNGTGVAEFVR